MQRPQNTSTASQAQALRTCSFEIRKRYSASLFPRRISRTRLSNAQWATLPYEYLMYILYKAKLTSKPGLFEKSLEWIYWCFSNKTALTEYKAKTNPRKKKKKSFSSILPRWVSCNFSGSLHFCNSSNYLFHEVTSFFFSSSFSMTWPWVIASCI